MVLGIRECGYQRKAFEFNIGYGFGDTSAASENMAFYDGVGCKLSQVLFHIPGDDYLKPWKFSSDDGRFEMDFRPVLDRAARTNALIIETDQHQVFGRMSGTVILDSGEKTGDQRYDVFCRRCT